MPMLCLTFVLALVRAEDIELEMEDEQLAVYDAGIPHPMGCTNEAGWENSCDINLTDFTLIQEANWSPVCDPWKFSTAATDDPPDEGWPGDYVNMTTTWTDGEWTCPEQYRSVSGCGDFRTDTRNVTCTSTYDFASTCTASCAKTGGK